MSTALLLISVGALWLAVLVVVLALCLAAKRGDRALERRIRDVSR